MGCSGALTQVWVATDYQKTAAELVKRLKFDRAAAAAKLLAAAISDTIPPLPPQTVVSHIPTASRRIRQRGYDQAALIAKHLAKQRRLPYRPLLKRTGQSRQVGANRSQRASQLDGAFTVRTTKLPEMALLVDDVLTTGATIEAAATALKKAGVTTVHAALFAQKGLD